MKNNAVAFIINNDWMSWPTHGTHNGYVAIPPENKYYRKHYNEINKSINVHGGLTYSEPVLYEKYTFGSNRKIIDSYVNEKNGILNKALFITDNYADIKDDWFIVGFDTNHVNDNQLNWNKERVIEETLNLLKQLTEDL